MMFVFEVIELAFPPSESGILGPFKLNSTGVGEPFLVPVLFVA